MRVCCLSTPPCLTHLRTLPYDVTLCSGPLSVSPSPPATTTSGIPRPHVRQLLPYLPLILGVPPLPSFLAYHSSISAFDLQLPCARVSPAPKGIAPGPSKQDATARQTLRKAAPCAAPCSAPPIGSHGGRLSVRWLLWVGVMSSRVTTLSPPTAIPAFPGAPGRRDRTWLASPGRPLSGGLEFGKPALRGGLWGRDGGGGSLSAKAVLGSQESTEAPPCRGAPHWSSGATS